MNYDPVDTDSLVKEAVDSTADGLPENGHDVSFELQADSQGLVGDGQRLTQALVNVVTNAFEAMSSGGTLAVQTSSNDNDVRIVITDTGHGIRAEEIPHATDQFFTRKDLGTGHGLGLAIARELIAQHGGELTLSSKLNEGTSVCIRIPKNNCG